MLMAALVFVWTHPRSPSEAPATIATMGAAKAEIDNVQAQEFTFSAGEHLIGDRAPQIAGRGFIITATVDAQQQDGVIVAQGGLAHGYALYVQGGELFFAVRRNGTITTAAGGKLPEGRHGITATWARNGELGLTLDGRSLATANAAGPIPLTPTDGFDVGSDRYAPVGPYKTPNTFGGIIESVTLKTFP
jgi:hypothetical protein